MRIFLVYAVVLGGFITGGFAKHMAAFQCPKAIFNFGDSLTDTGNAVLAFPYSMDAERSPYGSTFFGRPSRRFSDGRLVSDFIAQAFQFPLLDPYLEQVTRDFSRGVNYAVAGASASNDSFTDPFYLAFQIGQHRKFRNRVLSVKDQSKCRAQKADLPTAKSFRSGLYTIIVGGNDILNDYKRRYLNISDIITNTVPKIVAQVDAAVRALYSLDGRNFLISNVPPQGCAPLLLYSFAPLKLPADNLGCLPYLNAVPLAYNASLFAAVETLRSQLPEASITIFDWYAANIDILKNPVSYGFDPTKTLRACCGFGAPFYYNPNLTCGNSGDVNGKQVTAGACANPSRYISWDGNHYTEAFYRVISEKLLTGIHMFPPLNISSTCNLDLGRVCKNSSFKDEYKKTCSTLLVG